MQRINLPRGFLVLGLLLIHVALWLAPILRSLRFCAEAADLYAHDGAFEDLRYARSLRNEYVVEAAISLAYGLLGVRWRSRLLLFLGALQWLVPIRLILERPEQLYAIAPPLFASFAAGLCMYVFGGYLVFHIIYHLATTAPEPYRLRRSNGPPPRSGP